MLRKLKRAAESARCALAAIRDSYSLETIRVEVLGCGINVNLKKTSERLQHVDAALPQTEER